MTYKKFKELIKEKGFVKELDLPTNKFSVNLPDFYNSSRTGGSELIKGGLFESEAMINAYHLALYSIHNEPELVNKIYL